MEPSPENHLLGKHLAVLFDSIIVLFDLFV